MVCDKNHETLDDVNEINSDKESLMEISYAVGRVRLSMVGVRGTARAAYCARLEAARLLPPHRRIAIP